MSRLFLLFTLVPAIELYLLLVIGSWIGPGATVALLLGTGALGAWLARSQGARVLFELSEGLRRGESPAPRLVEGALVLLGGLLLLTPGVLTDALGIALLAPPTRRLLAPAALRLIGDAARRSGAVIDLGAPRPAGPPPRPAGPPPAARPFDHPTF